MKLKVLFANVYQGMIYTGNSESGEHLFSSWWPSKYVEYFKSYSPDICCFAEMVFDDEHNNSSMVEKMSKEYGLPYYKNLAGEKSWMVEGKYFGLSILSKYPIEEHEGILLPNPKLEIFKPNGDHWVSHDKTIQKAVLDINGKLVNVFNYQGFPYHPFKRKITEDDFAHIRLATSDILNESGKPSIITGDFNNKGIEIEEALPELFANGNIKRSVTFNPIEHNPLLHNPTQMDHVLLSKEFKVIDSKIDKNYSDHSAIILELEL